VERGLLSLRLADSILEPDGGTPSLERERLGLILLVLVLEPEASNPIERFLSCLLLVPVALWRDDLDE